MENPQTTPEKVPAQPDSGAAETLQPTPQTPPAPPAPAPVQPQEAPVIPPTPETGQPAAPPPPQKESGPSIADDVDVIEKEWVDKAQEVVKKTAGDPHAEEEAVEDLQADYLKKRYGVDINQSEDK